MAGSTRANGRRHKAVRVRVGKMSANIDVAIAPLIRALWQSEIETNMSCQCDGWGRVWIQFPTQADTVAFLDAVGHFEPGRNSLYTRMGQEWRADDPDSEWVYDLHPLDWAYRSDLAKTPDSMAHEGEPNFDFTYSVRFPPTDLQTVTARMLAYAQRYRSGGVREALLRA